MTERFADYDRDADIAWFPREDSSNVVSGEVEWGLIDNDSGTDEVVGVEVCSTSKRLAPEVLAALPEPSAAYDAAA